MFSDLHWSSVEVQLKFSEVQLKFREVQCRLSVGWLWVDCSPAELLALLSNCVHVIIHSVVLFCKFVEYSVLAGWEPEGPWFKSPGFLSGHGWRSSVKFSEGQLKFS